MLEPSAFEFQMAIEELKRHKSPGTVQIPTEPNKSGNRTNRSDIHKLINAIWNKEDLPEEWKELIIVPIYKNGGKTDCSNCRGISLMSTEYKILSNILLSRLTSFAETIIWDLRCGFRHNRSSTNIIFCIWQILETK